MRKLPSKINKLFFVLALLLLNAEVGIGLGELLRHNVSVGLITLTCYVTLVIVLLSGGRWKFDIKPGWFRQQASYHRPEMKNHFIATQAEVDQILAGLRDGDEASVYKARQSLRRVVDSWDPLLLRAWLTVWAEFVLVEEDKCETTSDSSLD